MRIAVFTTWVSECLYVVSSMVSNSKAPLLVENGMERIKGEVHTHRVVRRLEMAWKEED